MATTEVTDVFLFRRLLSASPILGGLEFRKLQIVWLFCMIDPHSLLYVISVQQLYSVYFTDIIYYQTIKKNPSLFSSDMLHLHTIL